MSIVLELLMPVLIMEEMEDVAKPIPSEINVTLFKDIPTWIVRMLLTKRALLLVEKSTDPEADVSWEPCTQVPH